MAARSESSKSSSIAGWLKSVRWNPWGIIGFGILIFALLVLQLTQLGPIEVNEITIGLVVLLLVLTRWMDIKSVSIGGTSAEFEPRFDKVENKLLKVQESEPFRSLESDGRVDERANFVTRSEVNERFQDYPAAGLVEQLVLLRAMLQALTQTDATDFDTLLYHLRMNRDRDDLYYVSDALTDELLDSIESFSNLTEDVLDAYCARDVTRADVRRVLELGFRHLSLLYIISRNAEVTTEEELFPYERWTTEDDFDSAPEGMSYPSDD